MYTSLCGEWQFCEKGKEWQKAMVPSCNYSDLLRNGKIKDPFIGLNEKEVFWVGEREWIYQKTFEVGMDMFESKRIELVCAMLDTLCTVYVNDKKVGEGKNCHISYRFDIKNAVQKGRNTVRIEFYPPVEYIREKAKVLEAFHNDNGLDGDTLMRKPQCHFGWDWGPVLPISGITKEIGIYYGPELYIDDFYIKQRHENGVVTLLVSAEIFGVKNEAKYIVCVTAPDGEKIIKEGVTKGKIEDDIVIQYPKLWWTHDISGEKTQPLYKVSLRVIEEEDNCETEKRIGLRTLVLERVKDEYGVSFRFILNGVITFCKGANWIPADSFEDRVTKESLRYLISSAQWANMNMLRVWGGGLYGSEDFYNLCDEMGIMVWQDCGFACQAYPLHDKEYMDNCIAEIESVAKRIRNHPSLAVWCGNNEVEHSNMWWLAVPKMKLYLDTAEQFFWKDLGKLIARYDQETSYIPGSPTGSEFMKEFADDTTGDTHLWQVWHGMQNPKYYRNRYTRFCSEFGFESLPDIKTIGKFAPGEEFSLRSKVFNSHQKCRNGNAKMVYYVRNRFRSPKKFNDFVYLSQVCQMECVKDATEFWRRNRHRCNGSLFWQINDCWPVCSWSSIDYYGNYKALQYVIRHTNSPVSVSIDDNKEDVSFYIVNDTLLCRDCKIRYEFSDFETGKVFGDTVRASIAPTSAKKVMSVPMKEITSKCKLNRTVVCAELLDEEGKVINKKTAVFGAEKNLCLPRAKIATEIKRSGDKIIVTISSDKYARLVRLENKASTLPFSDNFFDLTKGETKEITFPMYDNFDEKDFSVMSAVDVEPACPKLVDDIRRLLFLLRPINFAVFIGNLPKKKLKDR